MYIIRTYQSSVSSNFNVIFVILSPILLIIFIILFPDTAAVWLAFGNSVSSSKNSRKSGSVRREACAAVLFKNLSNAARRFSTNCNILKNQFRGLLDNWVKCIGNDEDSFGFLSLLPHLVELHFLSLLP